MEAYFDKEIIKKTMTKENKQVFMGRFSFSQKLEDLAKSQFIIEVFPLFSE